MALDPLFRVVDHATDRLLWDLNDPTGTGPQGVKTFIEDGALNLNVAERELVHHPMGEYAGEILVRKRLRNAVSSWSQFVQENAGGRTLESAVAELSRLLDLGSPPVAIKYQRSGGPLRYLDLVHSPEIPLLRGQERALFMLQTLRLSPSVPLAVERLPGLREDRVDSGNFVLRTGNLLHNGTMLEDQDGTGIPDNWVTHSAVTDETIAAATESFKFVVASASNTYVYQDRTVIGGGTVLPGDVCLFVFDAYVEAGTGARMRAQIDWFNAGTPISVVSGSQGTPDGSFKTLTTGWQRIYVIAAAPATTTEVTVELSITNLDATPYAIHVRNGMLVKSPTLVPFMVRSATVSQDAARGAGSVEGIVVPVWIDSDHPVPVETTATVDVSDTPQVTEVLVARRSGSGYPGARRLVDYLNSTKKWQLESGTLSNDTSVVADATASGSSKARCAYTVNPTVHNKRVRLNKTALLDSLRGTWLVYLRHQSPVGAVCYHQLKWGPGASDPCPHALGEVKIDTNGYSSAQWELEPMGIVHVPDELVLSTITVEVWSRRESGTGSADFDKLVLVPIDEMAGTVLRAESGSIEWKGKNLATPTTPVGLSAGTVSGERVKLDAVDEAGGSPPAGGSVFVTGHHKVTFKTEVVYNSGSFTLRVWNVTTNALVISKVISGHGDHDDVLEFDATGSQTYQIQVVVSAIGAQPSHIFVKKIVDDFVPVAVFDEAITMRRDARPPYAAKLDSSGALAQRLKYEGHLPIECVPGLNLLTVLVWDLPVGGAQRARHKLTRAPLLRMRYWPRRGL